MNPDEIPQQKPPIAEKGQSKFGVGFWILIIFAVLKDLTDIIFTLTVVLMPITSFTGFLMNAAIAMYFFFIGVKPDTKKVATFISSSIIDMLPGAGILPMTTFNLLFIRFLENKRSK